MVLIIEALDESFGFRFWEFIEEGGECEYRQKSAEKERIYRFSHPRKPGFPAMILSHDGDGSLIE